MSKMIQLRNVPDSLEGMSLSDYLVAEIQRSADRPTLRELRKRLRQRTPDDPSFSPAEVVRSERASVDDEVLLAEKIREVLNLEAQR